MATLIAGGIMVGAWVMVYKVAKNLRCTLMHNDMVETEEGKTYKCRVCSRETAIRSDSDDEYNSDDHQYEMSADVW